jgi:hypothetical protein
VQQVKEGQCKNYVPTTMDELMSRFVLNIKRGENNDNFEASKVRLEKKSLLGEPDELITESVQESM